ncbi:probable isocitrate dehydrogenase [NAD] subunit beta, mitochondrial [Hemitrygon akajei]|uniref:probable isocitrate dehydrogenase [NAD] subunit beta, mitochondrial n=1 Tax=Hemitrygon akajei TaxID=2704970 RepID=UPI003BF9AD9B
MATAVAPVLRRWLGAVARSPFGKPAQVLGATACGHRRLSAFVTDHSIPPPAKYGGRHTVAMIPGDGIGPELMAHVRDVFRCACVPIDFEVVDVRPSPDSGASLEGALIAIRRNRVALKGERTCGCSAALWHLSGTSSGTPPLPVHPSICNPNGIHPFSFTLSIHIPNGTHPFPYIPLKTLPMGPLPSHTSHCP